MVGEKLRIFEGVFVGRWRVGGGGSVRLSAVICEVRAGHGASRPLITRTPADAWQSGLAAE